MSLAAPKIDRFLAPLQGSYAADDCLFLLKPVTPVYRSVADKERLIQSGQMHYSQMIHKELPPTSKYTELFLQLTEQYKQRLAEQVMALASAIAEKRLGAITLVSLARAGTPIGVLLQRALTRIIGRQSIHYSISIVRDRGIDEVALDYLLVNGHPPESIVFVDGWTAKGVITRELQLAVADYNASRGVRISPELFVISDIGGTADVAATFDDYTIPSALMNSTVSGLISRSIINAEIGPTDYHGCVVYDHLRDCDRSNWFIDQVCSELALDRVAPPVCVPRKERQAMTKAFLDAVRVRHKVCDINRIKPGIAEATRVMLRRVPDLLTVREPGHPDVAHLERLAVEKAVPVEVCSAMPFGACALIRDVLK